MCYMYLSKFQIMRRMSSFPALIRALFVPMGVVNAGEVVGLMNFPA